MPAGAASAEKEIRCSQMMESDVRWRACGIHRQQLHLRAAGALVARLAALVVPVGLQYPGLAVVAEAEVQIPQQPLGMFRTADGESHLDAAEEVALHPVGARAQEVRLAVVRKVEHARVLEEAPDDRAHGDVL